MPETPLFRLRLPPYLRAEIERLKKDRTMTRWVIEAIEAKIKKEAE